VNDISWDTAVWIVGQPTVVTDACVVEGVAATRAASMDVLTTLCSMMRNFGFMSQVAVAKMLVLLIRAKMAGRARMLGTSNTHANARNRGVERIVSTIPISRVFAKCSMEWLFQKFGKLMHVAE